MSESIDRKSPVPFYFQLSEILRKAIESSGLKPGDRFWGDHELVETYGVSRSVVRQALGNLESDGIIRRVKGKGTFISAPKTNQGMLDALTGFYDDIIQRTGKPVRSEVLQQEVITAPQEVCTALDLPRESVVAAVKRLRFIDDQPVVLTTTYIDADLVEGIVDVDLQVDSLYRILREKYSINMCTAVRTIEIGTATKDVANLLGVAAGEPVLVLRNTSYDERRRPVETFVSYHRGDVARFEVKLEAGSEMRSNVDLSGIDL